MKKYFLFFICLFCIGIAFIVFPHTSLSTKEVVYQGSRLLVNVDGVRVSKLPTSGNYYLANYDCKSSNTVVMWDRNTYQLSVSNGNKKGGVSCYLDFQTNPKLSDMKVGSFVEYSGNNGCDKEQCSGKSQTYCNRPESQFYYDGFRIAYVSDNTAYLVSAGAMECDSQANLQQKSLKYCNTNYVYDGKCDESSVHPIGVDDFKIITNQGMDMNSCYNVQDKKCGYNNDLIDIGSDYWYLGTYQQLSTNSLSWSSERRSIYSSLNSSLLGIRPVIRMDDNVIVIGGSGTLDDPYKIANNTFLIEKIDTQKKVLSLRMIGKNISEMCINLNSTVCTNYIPFQDVYTLDVGKAKDKDNIIYVYYKDNEGNVIHTFNKGFSLVS